MTASAKAYRQFAESDYRLRERFGSIIHAFMNIPLNTSRKAISKNEEDHYPPNDYIDEQSGAQCFMHRHASGQRDSLHIHFFKRWQPPHIELNQQITTHIAALDLSLTGEPLGWFLVNQWVVGDYWQEAKKTLKFAKEWRIDDGNSKQDSYLPNKLIANWLNTVMSLAVKTSLPELLHERDKRIDRALSLNPNRQILLDKRIEVMGYSRFY